MGLDIFFAEDIRNALQAADAASTATAQVAYLATAVAGEEYAVELRGFRRGYNAALVTVALAFGLSPTIIGGEQQQWGLLDGQDTERQSVPQLCQPSPDG